jgi:hypothetical protein
MPKEMARKMNTLASSAHASSSVVGGSNWAFESTVLKKGNVAKQNRKFKKNVVL